LGVSLCFTSLTTDMFDADPHPAVNGFVAVHESYSRTVICSTEQRPAPRRRPESKPTPVYGRDRSPEPNRGFLLEGTHSRSNSGEATTLPPIIAVVGANSTSREHLLSARMADCLAARGLRVAVTRLTGARRTIFRESCNWISAGDLSDYGYVSTRTCDPRELAKLFSVQMTDIAGYTPDVVVIELCGTLWRQDVRSMLKIIGRSSSATGVVLSATEPAAAALGIGMVASAGLGVAALWTPRADCGALRRDSRVQAARVPVCGRGDFAAAARAVTTHLRRSWVPLDNGLHNYASLEGGVAA
jgi:hypothetical protein